MATSFKQARIFGKEATTADFIPYASHVTQSVVKLNTGDYLQTIRMQGAAHESADAADIQAWHEQLNHFMRNIASPHMAVWSHVVRRPSDAYPEGNFTPGFCHDFNEKYRRHMTSERMLVNELYLTLVFRPQPVKANRLLDRFAHQAAHDLQQCQLDELAALDDATGAALAALERYDPEVLCCYPYHGVLFSEVLEFLAFLVNGHWQRFPLPRCDINGILANTRPFFGKGGLMARQGPHHSDYACLVSIQEYPSTTYPGILNGLLGMPCEFVLSQSFTFLSKPVALGRMKRQQGRMVNAGDVAMSQIDAIDTALDDLTSNRFVMGAHSLSLMLCAGDAKALQGYLHDAGAQLSDAGMKWAREDAGMAGAFWAQLPGNFAYRVRVGDITSRNFAAFSCFHNYPVGRLHHNQWGPAVTMFRTTSGAPYYFNFHKSEDGLDRKGQSLRDANHKDLANTIVIGKSGTGKTVLEMVLLAQLQKFRDPVRGKELNCILFDKDLGASVGVRAMGGRYYPLKNGVPSGFNPFQLDATPNNLSFLEKLVRQLILQDGLPLTPKQAHDISAAIAGVMGASPSKRRLGALLEFLDPTESNGVHVRLARWCTGGPLGWLFDNAVDTLRLDACPLVGFDVTEFLDNDATRTPTILYLFHRIESLLDGRRIPIFMDEFWKLLGDEAFRDLAHNKLVTMRKQDGFLVMFTQSPRQVLQSPIAFAIVGQTATKIFLPNPEADYDDYVHGFKLSEREFEIVKSLGEKSRRFLVKQGQNSTVAELDLHGFDDELAVMSGNTATALLAERLVAELGDDPAVWLPAFHRQRKGELS